MSDIVKYSKCSGLRVYRKDIISLPQFFYNLFVHSRYVTSIYNMKKLFVFSTIVLCTNWYINSNFLSVNLLNSCYIGDHLPRKIFVLLDIFAVYFSASICLIRICFIVWTLNVTLVHFFLHISYLKIKFFLKSLPQFVWYTCIVEPKLFISIRFDSYRPIL